MEPGPSSLSRPSPPSFQLTASCVFLEHGCLCELAVMEPIQGVYPTKQTATWAVEIPLI